MIKAPHAQTMHIHYVERIDLMPSHMIAGTPAQDITIHMSDGGRVEITCFAAGDEPVPVNRPSK